MKDHRFAGQDSSRRDVLKALAAAGAAAVLPATGLIAQNNAKPAAGTRRGRIDVHHHHRPAEFGAAGGGRGGPQWSPAVSLEAMDKFNIDVALVSLTQQADQLYDGTGKGRAFARTVNDY